LCLGKAVIHGQFVNDGERGYVLSFRDEIPIAPFWENEKFTLAALIESGVGPQELELTIQNLDRQILFERRPRKTGIGLFCQFAKE
jgi:hypothetical protein